MPLTDDDIDRIGDKIELKFNARMDTHIQTEHKPIWIKLNKIDIKLAGYGGAIALAMAAIELFRQWHP